MSLRGKWNFTEESTEESTKHRIRKGGEEGAELPDHAQGEHEGRPILYHPAAADLQDTPEAEVQLNTNSPGLSGQM